MSPACNCGRFDLTTSQTGPAFHDLADFDRLRVGGAGVHAAAHVRVEREVDRAQQHLAGAGLGNVGLDQLEIVRGWARRCGREARRIWRFFVGSRVSGVFVG